MSCICIVFHIDQTLYDLTIPWIRKVRESHEWIELNEFPKQILFEMSMAFFALHFPFKLLTFEYGQLNLPITPDKRPSTITQKKTNQ